MERTPATSGTHAYLAQRVIAFCAAYVDVNLDPSRMPMINTDELISAACAQFGISGRESQETFGMREDCADNMTRGCSFGPKDETL